MAGQTDNCIANVSAHRILAFGGDPHRDLVDYLHGHGVDVDASTNLAGPIAHMTVTFEGDAFAYDPLGEAGAAICVHDVDAETVIDLVAWSLRYPEMFATFLGKAGLLGGNAIVNPASFHNGPCPIWSTPLRWLRSGCSGAIVLNTELARSVFAKAPASGQFVAEDLDLAHDLVTFGLVCPDHLLVPDSRVAA